MHFFKISASAGKKEVFSWKKLVPKKDVKICIKHPKNEKKAKTGFGVKIGPLRHPPLAGGRSQ